MWRINREAVLLGAGPAALLLQIAHPLVAEGVAAHSDFRPIRCGGCGARCARRWPWSSGTGRRPNARCAASTGSMPRSAAGRGSAARGARRGRTYRALDPSSCSGSRPRSSSRASGPTRPGSGRCGRRSGGASGRRPVPSAALGHPAGGEHPTDWPGLVAWFDDSSRPVAPSSSRRRRDGLAPDIVRPPLRHLPPPLWSCCPAGPGTALPRGSAMTSASTGRHASRGDSLGRPCAPGSRAPQPGAHAQARGAVRAMPSVGRAAERAVRSDWRRLATNGRGLAASRRPRLGVAMRPAPSGHRGEVLGEAVPGLGGTVLHAGLDDGIALLDRREVGRAS